MWKETESYNINITDQVVIFKEESVKLLCKKFLEKYDLNYDLGPPRYSNNYNSSNYEQKIESIYNIFVENQKIFFCFGKTDRFFADNSDNRVIGIFDKIRGTKDDCYLRKGPFLPSKCFPHQIFWTKSETSFSFAIYEMIFGGKDNITYEILMGENSDWINGSIVYLTKYKNHWGKKGNSYWIKKFKKNNRNPINFKTRLFFRKSGDKFYLNVQ